MLNKYDAAVTLATKDIDASRKFYTKSLGLKEKEVDEEGLVVPSSGSTTLYLYPAGSATLTSICCIVRLEGSAESRRYLCNLRLK
jgi:catechol 2,3-dioxygenase-like lactoylglutathione lyase family enzyme